MKELAPGLDQLRGFPPNAVNVYVAGDVLIDAATRLDGWHLKRQLQDRPLALLALTHAHPDHQGSAKAICEARHIPLACHSGDVEAMEGGFPSGMKGKAAAAAISGPAYPVSRVLADGDEIGEFRVIHAPGHSAGHVIYFRDSDRVAISGDVLRTMNLLTMIPQIGEMPKAFITDLDQSHASIKLLAELNPTLVCPGHGPPLRDIAKLEAFAAKF